MGQTSKDTVTDGLKVLEALHSIRTWLTNFYNTYSAGDGGNDPLSSQTKDAIATEMANVVNAAVNSPWSMRNMSDDPMTLCLHRIYDLA